jgi:aminopeptidase N
MEGERLLGLYQDGVIWVSDELNRRQAVGVIAHEVGHAWFFENRTDIDTPDELLFEGFAEWISFLALSEVGDRDGAAGIEYADQSVYGKGARKLIARHRREGLEAVLELVLTGHSL